MPGPCHGSQVVTASTAKPLRSSSAPSDCGVKNDTCCGNISEAHAAPARRRVGEPQFGTCRCSTPSASTRACIAAIQCRGWYTCSRTWYAASTGNGPSGTPPSSPACSRSPCRRRTSSTVPASTSEPATAHPRPRRCARKLPSPHPASKIRRRAGGTTASSRRRRWWKVGLSSCSASRSAAGAGAG